MSEWSSAVCSSGLPHRGAHRRGHAGGVGTASPGRPRPGSRPSLMLSRTCHKNVVYSPHRNTIGMEDAADRKSVVKGKRVSGRVVLGGRRILKISTKTSYSTHRTGKQTRKIR